MGGQPHGSRVGEAVTGWPDRQMVSFDCETTGVSYEKDWILSASIVNIVPGQPLAVVTEYCDHGLPDPLGGSQIHKLTAAHLAANATAEPAAILDAVCDVLSIAIDEQTPLVGMNLVFDLTMLDRNCRRLGVRPLADRCTIYAADALVLDKGVDPYRKGKRNLAALATHYRVPWDESEAHTSAADAVVAARVVWRIGRLYPRLASLSIPQLHQLQREWKQGQDASFAEYRRKRNEDASGLDGHWPVKPLLAVVR